MNTNSEHYYYVRIKSHLIQLYDTLNIEMVYNTWECLQQIFQQAVSINDIVDVSKGIEWSPIAIAIKPSMNVYPSDVENSISSRYD